MRPDAGDGSARDAGDGSARDAGGDGSARDDGDGSARDAGDGSARDDGDGSARDAGDGSARDGAGGAQRDGDSGAPLGRGGGARDGGDGGAHDGGDGGARDGRGFDGYDIVADERIGEGGFLRIRRLRLRVRRADGSRSKEGLYDFVERPMGADAVVLVLWHRAPDGVRVLLRHAPRVPLYFRDPAFGRDHAEVVAGIIERGEDDWVAIQRRAAAEAHEEAGLVIAPDAVERLGPAVFPTAGLFAELFHFAAAEVADPARAVRPPTDGSPFEEGARLDWVALDEALRRCDDGGVRDLKTELALRRLRAKIQ